MVWQLEERLFNLCACLDKNNTAKYSRAKDKDGSSFEMLSALDPASQNADARAFKALMHHIKEVDSRYQTVIVMQVENEIGFF